ncbi:hypothetical protein HD806DRAFT_207789 [Xylariaceae sp. AK1471]|nr:hypothetical protein HD806DRAFT_207789 [Xylariaceae sp. AK1471]
MRRCLRHQHQLRLVQAQGVYQVYLMDSRHALRGEKEMLFSEASSTATNNATLECRTEATRYEPAHLLHKLAMRPPCISQLERVSLAEFLFPQSMRIQTRA